MSAIQDTTITDSTIFGNFSSQVTSTGNYFFGDYELALPNDLTAAFSVTSDSPFHFQGVASYQLIRSGDTGGGNIGSPLIRLSGPGVNINIPFPFYGNAGNGFDQTRFDETGTFQAFGQYTLELIVANGTAIGAPGPGQALTTTRALDFSLEVAPEPSRAVLILGGLVAVGLRRRRPNPAEQTGAANRRWRGCPLNSPS